MREDNLKYCEGIVEGLNDLSKLFSPSKGKQYEQS